MPISHSIYLIFANKKILFLFILLSISCFSGFSQTMISSNEQDSVSVSAVPSDGVIPQELTDSVSQPLDTVAPAPKSNQIDAQIQYSAQDSIVFYRDGTGYLHGNGDVKYQNISLNAEYIRVSMDSSTLFAKGVPDSIGDMIGEPIFGEGESKYDAKEITYNLKTKKGYVKHAVTQQGEAYVISEKTKKTEDDLINVAGAKYTTCDNHEHPHFYLNIKEGKVKPGSYVVSGPANIVVADVPLPIYIPFGYFPFNSDYSSGLLMPTFVDELNRGLGLTNGGYYFAFNDYFDLELRGDIFTKGTWRVAARSSYTKRYKFSGSLGIDYQEYVTGEKNMPDYNKQKNLQVSWSHRQDAKANPYRTLSASVNFSTSGYNQNNIHNNFNPAETSQNTKTSSVNISQRFAKIPVLSLNGGMRITQVSKDSTLSLSLPDLSISVSRIYPMKRKEVVGKERWYEKIYLSYSGNFQNSYSGKENKLLTSSFSRDWQMGMKHSIPVGASFNLFNFLTVTPSFTYNERWHIRSVRKHYDTSAESVVTDTVSGFNRNYDFNMGVSLQTKLYGYYIPLRSIFGDKVDRIRHVVTPSISFNYHPDFSDPQFGMYDSYVKTNLTGQAPGYEEILYSKYESTMFGGPGMGKSGSLSFSLSNNLEMKVRNDKDTTGTQPFKKVSLIDDFTISGGYNFMADSCNLSNIQARLRIKTGNNRSISLSGSFDPYVYVAVDDGNSKRVVRTNEYVWNRGKFPHFLGTSASHTITLDNNTFKKWFGKKDEEKSSEGKEAGEGTEEVQPDKSAKRYSSKKDRGNFDEDGYEKITIPWSVNISYSISYSPLSGYENYDAKKMFYKMALRHSLQLSANVSLTKNWKINGNTSFDFDAKKFTQMNINITRNLHCWSITAMLQPIGYYKSYYVKVGVNSSMLQDLKVEKRKLPNSNQATWF